MSWALDALNRVGQSVLDFINPQRAGQVEVLRQKIAEGAKEINSAQEKVKQIEATLNACLQKNPEVKEMVETLVVLIKRIEKVKEGFRSTLADQSEALETISPEVQTRITKVGVLAGFLEGVQSGKLQMTTDFVERTGALTVAIIKLASRVVVLEGYAATLAQLAEERKGLSEETEALVGEVATLKEKEIATFPQMQTARTTDKVAACAQDALEKVNESMHEVARLLDMQA